MSGSINRWFGFQKNRRVVCYECQEGTSSQCEERGKGTCLNWVFTRKPRRRLHQQPGQWGKKRVRGRVWHRKQQTPLRRGNGTVGRRVVPQGQNSKPDTRLTTCGFRPWTAFQLTMWRCHANPSQVNLFHSPWARLDPTPRAPGPRPNTLRHRSPSRAMGNHDHNHGLDFFPFSTDHQLCKPWRIIWPARDDQNFGQSAMTQTGSNESGSGSSHQLNWEGWWKYTG